MNRITWLLLSSLLCTVAAADDPGYALGVGVAADNGDGFTGTIIGNLIVNDELLLSANFASTQADAFPEDIQTRDWELSAHYDFGAIGIEAFGGQSGDPDDFDAQDLSAGFFHYGDHWSWSARYLTRDIDLILSTPNVDRLDDISVPLEATGWRASLGYRTESGFRVSANARRFDYDRNLEILGSRVIVQRLSPTSLTLATSLLDQSMSVTVEWPLKDLRAINLSVSRDELAGNLGSADTYSAGFLTPIGQRGDLDIAVGVSQGTDGIEGDTIFLSIFYMFYGSL